MIWIYKLVNGKYEVGANVGISASMGKTWVGDKHNLRRLCDVKDLRVENLLYSNREQFGLFYDESKDPWIRR